MEGKSRSHRGVVMLRPWAPCRAQGVPIDTRAPTDVRKFTHVVHAVRACRSHRHRHAMVALCDKLSLPLTIVLASMWLGEPLSPRLVAGVVPLTIGALLTIV